jgi:hypothetical protein
LSAKFWQDAIERLLALPQPMVLISGESTFPIVNGPTPRAVIQGLGLHDLDVKSRLPLYVAVNERRKSAGHRFVADSFRI